MKGKHIVVVLRRGLAGSSTAVSSWSLLRGIYRHGLCLLSTVSGRSAYLTRCSSIA